MTGTRNPASLTRRYGLRWRVRNRLVAAFLALFLPFTIILAWSFNRTYYEREEEVIEGEREHAVLLAATFADWIDRSMHLEELLAESILRNRGEGVLPLSFDDVMRLSPPVEEILYIDRHGRVLHSTNRRHIGRNDTASSYVRVIASGREQFLSDVLSSDGHQLFAVAHEVRATKEDLVGLIVMLIRSDSIDLILGSDLNQRHTGAIVLTDSTGRVAFHSGMTDPASTRSTDGRALGWGTQPFVKLALDGGIGAARQFLNPLTQTVQVGAQVPVRNLGWTAGSYVDERAALGPVRRQARLELTVVLIIASAGIATAIVLARRITGPIRVLKRGAKEFAAGDLAYRIETGSEDELGDLATAFNNMADALQQREEGLTRSADSERIARARSEALVEELAEETHRLKILHGIAATATDNLDVAAVARAAASGLIGTFGLRRVGVWLSSPASMRLTPIAVEGYADSPPEIALDDARLGDVLRTGKRLFIEDASDAGSDLGELFLPVASGGHSHDASFVVLPLRAGSITAGVLYASADPARHFRWRLREFLATVADQLAIAIEKIRNIEQTRSEKLFTESVLNNIPAGVVVLDPQNLSVVLANRQYAELSGRDSSEELVDHAFDQVVPGGAAALMPVVQQVISTGCTAEMAEMDVGGPRGQTYWTWRIVPLYRNPGTLNGLLMLVMDTTEQVRARRQVEDLANLAQERASKLGAVVESMADGVVITDRDGFVSQINRAAAAMFGLASREAGLVPPAELIDLLDMRHLDGQRVRARELPMARVVGGEIVTDMRVVVRRARSGREAVLSVTGAPIRDVDGRVAGGVAVVRDVTEAEKLARAKDDFLSIASHELKTPITAIKGMAQASQRVLSHGGSVNPEFLDVINRQTDRLVRLINDLLDLSRIQTGRLTLRRERTDLAKLARSVVDQVRLQTDRHHIVLTTSTPEVTGFWDAQRLEQVIGNLLGNAVKYSPRGGDIHLHIQRHDDHVTFSVRDAGVGIPSDDLPQLFERFFRASNVSANNISGLGVGLYICREIVQRHGGDIRVHSREGSGTTFEVMLPYEIGSRDQSRVSTLSA